MSELSAISFEVRGVPVAQGSKRPFARNGRAWLVDANDSKLKPWRAVVNSAAAEAMKGLPLMAGPLEVCVEFRMPRPKGHYGSGKNATTLKAGAPKYHAKKPDADKLLRAVFDSMTGVVYADDSQVCVIRVSKFFSDWPGCAIVVSRAWDSELASPAAEKGTQ